MSFRPGPPPRDPGQRPSAARFRPLVLVTVTGAAATALTGLGLLACSPPPIGYQGAGRMQTLPAPQGSTDSGASPDDADDDGGDDGSNDDGASLDTGSAEDVGTKDSTSSHPETSTVPPVDAGADVAAG